MVFSLFRRQDKAATRKGRLTESVDSDTDTAASADTERGSFGNDLAGPAKDPNSPEAKLAAREAARLTAEKIDQIENEIIADALTGIGSVPPPQGVVADALALSQSSQNAELAGVPSKPTAVQQLQALTDRENGVESSFGFSATGVDTQAINTNTNINTAIDTSINTDLYPESLIDTGGGARKKAPDTQADLAIDIVDGSLPGQLEEAAILYSNRQYQPTVETLNACLVDTELSQQHQLLAWLMLFDLMQVMGERDQFDSLAIRYASLTESSPPTWSDALRVPDRGKSDRRSSPSHIFALRELDGSFGKFVEQLTRAAGNGRECSIDFSSVRELDGEAAAEVSRLINEFVQLNSPLGLTGVEAFLDLTMTHIEVGRADDSEAFWQLSLLLLRLMGEQTRFEDLSIDYCVTFEVSPPPWEPLPSLFPMTDDLESSFGAADNKSPEGSDQQPRQVEVTNNRLVLRNDLTGRIEGERQAMRKLAESNSVVKVDCRLLRLMDFSAAGEMLNELAAIMGRGRKVQFIEPNFLVYALMLVMGIHELAEIRRRKI